MTGSALFRFTLLAAIWGASFFFIRILAPEVGGVWTAQSRLTIGALALFAFVWLRKIPLQMHQWRHYLIAGVLNCAIPFAMYGVAGTILPAGYGFGLGGAVRLATGGATRPGSAGHYSWSGMGGTFFFVDPAQDLFAILLTQAPGQLEMLCELFPTLVYAAL